MGRKILAVSGVIGFLATAGVAFAQTTAIVGGSASSSTTTTVVPKTQPMVLEVSPRGKALLRGTVTAVSANLLTVTGWGGSWTINVPASAQILPHGMALSSFQQGDFVGIEGTVSQDANFTVDATLIRDWTARKAAHQEIKQNIQSVRAMQRSETPRITEGTVSALDTSAQTFTLTTKSGMNYSVSLTSSARVLQKNWVTFDLSKVQDGDTVRVWGPVASSTVSASVLRDLSVPRR